MKKLLLSLFAVFVCFMLSACGATKLNETVEIKEDNIKFTVLGSETVTIPDDGISVLHGDFVKVNVKVENTGTETYKWNALNFSLDDKTIALLALGQQDFLVEEIAAGETVTGYLYFEKTDAKVLTYFSHFEAASTDTAKTVKYEFNIK